MMSKKTLVQKADIIMGNLIPGKMGDLGSTQAKVQHICHSQWAARCSRPCNL